MEYYKMKKKTVDLKFLWERAGKSQKTTSTSTPKPIYVGSKVNSNSTPILALQLQEEHNDVTRLTPILPFQKKNTVTVRLIQRL